VITPEDLQNSGPWDAAHALRRTLALRGGIPPLVTGQESDVVRISILYPAKTGARFDVDYYLSRHVPLALGCLGGVVIGFSVDLGRRRPPWPAPAFLAMAHYLCESQEAFEAAYRPHARALQEDVANYTDIEPIYQVSDVAFHTP
jgi:uncharacterized protein (TIGR02118 family)